MKILQVATPFLEVRKENRTSGITTIVRQLTDELVRRGHHITLFAPKGSRTKAKLAVSVPRALEYVPGVTPYGNDLPFLFGVLAKAIVYAEKNHFDIIHNHINLAAPALAELTRIPIITTLHYGYYPPEQQEYLRSFSYKNYVALSRHAKQQHSQYLWCSTIIPNGVDLKEFQYREKAGNRLVWLGGINPLKGAVEAIQIAKKAHMPLDLWGTIRDKDYFQKKVKPYLFSKIRYRGVITSAQKRSTVLGNAYALLFPVQWNEPFGLVMIEAMACGTPVLGFNRGAVGEIVQHGKTGYIAKTVSGLTSYVKQIADIDRAACHKHVEKYFTVERMTERYEQAYQSLMKRKA